MLFDFWLLLIHLKQIKSEKISPQQNKYEYVNMPWWKGFNDDILNSYILKAVDNNKDLKKRVLFMAKTTDMTMGSPFKRILIFAIPIALGFMLQNLYSLGI